MLMLPMPLRSTLMLPRLPPPTTLLPRLPPPTTLPRAGSCEGRLAPTDPPGRLPPTDGRVDGRLMPPDGRFTDVRVPPMLPRDPPMLPPRPPPPRMPPPPRPPPPRRCASATSLASMRHRPAHAATYTEARHRVCILDMELLRIVSSSWPLWP